MLPFGCTAKGLRVGTGLETPDRFQRIRVQYDDAVFLAERHVEFAAVRGQADTTRALAHRDRLGYDQTVASMTLRLLPRSLVTNTRPPAAVALGIGAVAVSTAANTVVCNTCLFISKVLHDLLITPLSTWTYRGFPRALKGRRRLRPGCPGPGRAPGPRPRGGHLPPVAPAGAAGHWPENPSHPPSGHQR